MYENLCIGISQKSWSWSHDSWIYNYLSWVVHPIFHYFQGAVMVVIVWWHQRISPLKFRVWITYTMRGVLICDKVFQWLATGRWFSPGTPVSSINKTDRIDIPEILLKVALNVITLTLSPTIHVSYPSSCMNYNLIFL